MKKRIISVLIILCMLIAFNSGNITASTGAALENNWDGTYELYSQCSDFFVALGIAGGDEDFATVVTRGDAAEYISLMLDDSAAFKSYRGIFTDVPAEYENALAIEKLSDLGVVKGDGNYCYRPNDMLTYPEATRMLVNALGYGVIDDIDGTFSAIAQREGITDGIINEYSVVNIGDFFVMMYNTYMANPIVLENWANNNDYSFSKQTLLYTVRGIVCTDGILVNNDLTYLWSPRVERENMLEIELPDKSRLCLINPGMEALRDDLGKNVTVFYKYDRERNADVYVHHIVDSNNKILKIGLEVLDLENADLQNGRIQYYTDLGKRVKSERLSDDYYLIYNNVAYKSHMFDFNAVSDKVGSLELIDADSNGVYETVKIKVYDSLIVENKSSEYGFITDKFDVAKKINTDEDIYKKIFIRNKTGNEISFSDIGVGGVVSVAASDAAYSDENVLEIYYSDEVSNGKITAHNETGDSPVLEIDYGNQYKLFDRAKLNTYVINRNVIIYLDSFGNAVYVSDDLARDTNYGLITRLGFKKSGIDDKISVRYINSAGELIDSILSDKVIIDGESFKNNPEKAYKILSDLKISVDNITVASGIIPIRYRADENGILIMIDTVNPGLANVNDKLEFTGGGLMAVFSGNILGWTVPFSGDALVMEIFADDFTDVDEYEKSINVNMKVASAVLKSGTENHKVLAYKSDENSAYSDFIIRFLPNTVDFGASFFVVEDTACGLNPNNEEGMLQLNGYLKGVYTKIYADESVPGYDKLKNLKCGDVIRYIASRENSIIRYEPILIQNDDGTRTLNNVNSGLFKVDTHASVSILGGYVAEKEGSLIKTNQLAYTTFTPNPEAVDWTENLKYTGITETATVVVVDSDNKTISKGSIDDILDYKNFESECSLALMRFRTGVLNEIIVYN